MANFLITVAFGAVALCALAYNVLIGCGADPAAALAIGLLCIGCCAACLVLLDTGTPELSITAWAIPIGASAFATHQDVTTGNVVAFAALACIIPFAMKGAWAFDTITGRLCALVAASLTLIGLYGQTTAVGYGTAVGLWLCVALACIRPSHRPATEDRPLASG